MAKQTYDYTKKTTQLNILANISIESGNDELYIATEGQTTFAVTTFTVTDDNYIIFVDNALQLHGYSRVGQDIVFTNGLIEGAEIYILQK